MTIRCDECKKDIIKDIKQNDWLLLMHYVNVLLDENQITNNTYERMIDALLTFKQFAFDWDYRSRKDRMFYSLLKYAKDKDDFEQIEIEYFLKEYDD